MIGLDTNVLVRLLTADDPAQFAVVRDLLEAHRGEQDAFFVNDLVLAETWWVLSRRYQLSRNEILDALLALANNLGFAFSNRERIQETLQRCRSQTSNDFADMLIVLKNRDAGCTQTVSFDRRLTRLPDVVRPDEIAGA